MMKEIEGEVLPKGKSTQKTAKPRKPRTTKKDLEQQALHVADKFLPESQVERRERREVAIPREVMAISRLGSEAAHEIGVLSAQLLDRVKVADAGDVGKNMTELLALTQRVDFDKLGSANDKGIMARLRNIFGDTKVKVLAEFQTVSEQMTMMVDQVQGGISRMHGETDWLISNIKANNDHIEQMEDLQLSLEKAAAEELAHLEQMKKDPNVRANDLFEQSNLVDALDKQYNKVLRMGHLAKLSDPQYKSMLVVNQSTIEKFEDIKTNLIPMMQSRLSMELLSLQQGKDNELSAAYDREANRIVVDTSKSIANNMKEAAKASNRSIVELESLRQVQTNIVGALQEVIKINTDHRAERQRSVQEIRKMNDELDSSMRGIADKANNFRLRN